MCASSVAEDPVYSRRIRHPQTRRFIPSPLQVTRCTSHASTRVELVLSGAPGCPIWAGSIHGSVPFCFSALFPQSWGGGFFFLPTITTREGLRLRLTNCSSLISPTSGGGGARSYGVEWTLDRDRMAQLVLSHGSPRPSWKA